MVTVSISGARRRWAELARIVEGGETVVITRKGKPILDMVPHRPRGEQRPRRGLNWEALRRFKAEHGIDRIVGDIPADFDDPLPEDILIRPLPPEPSEV